jgi:hypothetical protein
MKQIASQSVQPERRTGQVITCTGIDAMLQHVPVSVVFLFEQTLDHRRLIDSLPRLLTEYPLFAGRLQLIDNRLQIECNDQGVRVSVVERSDTLDDILQDLRRPGSSKLVDTVSSRAALEHGGPITSIRISHLRGGGSALGLSWIHSLGDMQTLMCMLSAWSQLLQGHEIDTPLMPANRIGYLTEHVTDNGRTTPGVRRVSVVELAKLFGWVAWNARSSQPVSFYFSEPEKLAIRDALQAESGVELSANDALCAHMFSLIADFDPKPRSHQLSIGVNFRTRYGLSPMLLGNMISALNVVREPGEPAANVAVGIRRGLDHFADSHMDYFSNERFIAAEGGASTAARMIFPVGLDPLRGNLLLSNQTGFDVCSLDFGGARAFAFDTIGMATMPWLSSLTDGFWSRGSIFGACLPQEITRKLCSETGLHSVHRYRPTGDERPHWVEKLSWLLA